MKNHKQLLADFYLQLLTNTDEQEYLLLKMSVLTELSIKLDERPQTIQRIFERMAAEDAKF